MMQAANTIEFAHVNDPQTDAGWAEVNKLVAEGWEVVSITKAKAYLKRSTELRKAC